MGVLFLTPTPHITLTLGSLSLQGCSFWVYGPLLEERPSPGSSFSGVGSRFWVLEREANFCHHNKEILSVTKDPYHGNLDEAP